MVGKNYMVSYMYLVIKYLSYIQIYMVGKNYMVRID